MTLTDKGLKSSEVRDYGTVLQKLLPAEVTGAYLTIRTLFNQVQQQEGISEGEVQLLAFFAIILAIVSYFILERAFGVTSRIHRLFYCGCFLIWAANIETDKLAVVYFRDAYLPLIIGAITIIVSFGVPYFLRPIKQAE
jgi:hypothetical protein